MNCQPGMTSPIRAVIVDDHGVVREGLTLILEREGHIEVVATAADGKQGVAAALLHKPDIVVMDLVLPVLSGIDATQQIIGALPQSRVVILSSSDTSEHVFRAFRAGATGYVLKECAGEDLVRAMMTVLAGTRYLSPQLTGALIDGLLSNTTMMSPLESLSAREREVMNLTVAGSSSAQIALRLCLSRKTVDTYRSRVMLKLGVPDLARLIHFGVEHAMMPARAVPTIRQS
jgi:DNA-binding NarL/FixJ family response regulator